MQKVSVDGKWRLAALVLWYRNLMFLSEVDEIGSRLELPLAPRRNDLYAGVERIGCQLEAHLIIPFSGRPVRDGIGILRARDLDHPFGDQRTGDRGSQKILPFINGSGLDDREDEITREFFAEILNVKFP